MFVYVIVIMHGGFVLCVYVVTVKLVIYQLLLLTPILFHPSSVAEPILAVMYFLV